MRHVIRWVVAIGVAIAITGSVLAVEKKEKAAPPAQQAKPAQVKPQQGKQTTQPAQTKQAAPPKKYDDFVDTNHNGIDDRKENLKKKDGK